MPIFISGSGGSGAYKLTATCSSEYIGATITATLGTNVKSSVVDSAGKAVLSLNKEGTWTISNSVNSFTQSVVVSLKQLGGTTFDHATINVSSNVNGTALTFTNGSHTATATVTNGTASVTVMYAGTWTISAVDADANTTVSVTEMKSYGVTYNPFKIYGVRVSESNGDPNTRVEYVDDAVGMTPAYMNYSSSTFNYGSWADVFFIKNNYPCVLGFNGVEGVKLNPSNLAKDVNGNSVAITADTLSGNVMAVFPLVYVYRYESEGYKYIKVCKKQLNSNYKAYAHTRSDGTVQSKRYMAIYKGYKDSSDRMRSISGKTPTISLTAQAEMTACQANGTGDYCTRDWAIQALMQDLLCIISKSTDGQTAFGNGNCASSGLLTTGTLNTSGAFFGYNSKTSQVKVFHVESWWGDVNDRCAGLMTKADGKVYAKMTPPYNFDASGYSVANESVMGNGGRTNTTKVSEFGMIPTGRSGTSATYWSDYGYSGSGLFYAYVGGRYSDDLDCGPWYLSLGAAPSGTFAYVGSSLSFR